MISWGIIGCGDVAEVKSGPAFQITEGSELVAVMRRDAVKAADFARRHGVPYWYANAEQLLANDAINAVYIATPPSTHFYYTERALAAGKNVYLEKPMVLNLAEADAICAMAERYPTSLTVAHYRRYLPAFILVKELLESGAIGVPRSATIEILQAQNNPSIIANSEDNWRVDPAVSGGGLFYDIAPHQIDLMTQYFGSIRSASGASYNQTKINACPDYTQGSIEFENGMIFNGVWAFNVSEASSCERCMIHGSAGRIEFSFYGSEVILQQGEASKTYHFEAEKHVQRPMVEAVVRYFSGDQNHNPCSAAEARIVASVMEAFSVTPENL